MSPILPPPSKKNVKKIYFFEIFIVQIFNFYQSYLYPQLVAY